MPFCFPKSEKLCGKLRIQQLYSNGKHFTCWPLRVTYHYTTNEEIAQPNTPIQVLIWAPKSLFRRANKRNHLRRLMREAYRLNANPLRQHCTANNLRLQVAFNYISKEEMTFQQIQKAMQKALKTLEGR